MKTLILQFVILGLATAALANNEEYFSITTNQAAEVKQTLELFDKGEITLDQITVGRDEMWGHTLVVYYETHTNDVTTSMKLPISRCYGAMDRYSEAVRLAQDYVTVFSNDWRGWRIIGSANIDLKNFDAAVSAYTNAVRLGDNDGSCIPLAFTAMKIDRLDIVKNILSRLFDLKNSKTLSHRKSLEAVGALVLYSLRTNQKDIFAKALSGLSNNDFMSRNDLKFLVDKGCEQFQGADIDRIRQEMASATSSTNSVSSPPR